MHVGDRVDPDRLGEYTIYEDEWETANDSTAHAEVGSDVRKRWPHSREPHDQLHRSLHCGDKSKAATGTLLLIVVRGSIELDASYRSELDRSHERF